MGTLFEIEPKEPYSDDDLNWSDDNRRVYQKNMKNEDERNSRTCFDNSR